MSLVVAVFNQTSEWSGKTVSYEDARHQFVLQGRGPISPQALLEHDAQGQLDWIDESLREWTQRAARTTAVAESVTAEPSSPSSAADTTTRHGGRGTPGEEAARISRTRSLAMADAAKAASVEPGPTPGPENPVPDPATARPASAAQARLAEAGFVCSLFGLGVPLLGVLGLILSIAARRQAQRLGVGKVLPTAGIVIGVISTVVGLLLILVALVG